MLLVFVCTLAVFMLVVGVLLWVKTPHYQMQPADVARLFKAVLVGQASENEWAIFLASSFRHYPPLESIRARCLLLDETEYLGATAGEYLLSAYGLLQLKQLLAEVEAMAP